MNTSDLRDLTIVGLLGLGGAWLWGGSDRKVTRWLGACQIVAASVLLYYLLQRGL